MPLRSSQPAPAHGAPGTPVASIPTADLPGIAAFRPGFWNEEYFGPAVLRQMVENYKRLAAPDPKTGQPYYVPYVSINHDKFPHLAGFQFGELKNVRVDNTGTLTMDATDVPTEVGAWRNSGLLRKASIEFVRPQRDGSGQLVGGFRGPDGAIIDGPVIKCLTLLGADVPGVKGLPELPEAVYSSRPAPVARFSATPVSTLTFGEATMTREQLLAALTAAGVDVSTVTETVPDAFLQAVLDAIQKSGVAPAPPPAEAGTPPAQMSDLLSGLGAALPTAGAAGTPGQTPSQVVVKFNQQYPGLLGTLAGALSRVQQQAAAVDRVQGRIIDGGKRHVIDNFFARMSESGQITTNMQPRIRALLMKCDHVRVAKFADGGGEGTELEESIRGLEMSLPKQRTFEPKVQQRSVNHTGQSAVAPDRRGRILAGAGVKPKALSQ